MAFSLDFDIYNWLLVEILKVTPTGDPVNDAVYLVLLPMVVLYMFVSDVTSRSRFNHASIKFIIMFVMGFFIVRQGLYPLFAGFSLPLLIIIMVWYGIEFIRGETKSAKVDYSYQRSSGGESSGVREEQQSMLASLAQFIGDAQKPGKFFQKDYYVNLINDIRRLKINIDENIETFAGMASSREGNKNSADIVRRLRELRLELTEIERKINDGEPLEGEEKNIAKFRQHLQEIMKAELN